MADLDEDRPRKARIEIAIGEELGLLSVAELEARIALLEGEIARLREAIAGKRSSRVAANAVFKS
jgi:uncharacterized small protein (DUF1192 family)